MKPREKPASCSGCPAEHWGVGFVDHEGPSRAQLVIVGQGPGEMEARFSRPFFEKAPAGSRLTRWLHQAGLQRTEVLITNSVWCWLPQAKPNGLPKGNREPTPDELKECYRRHLGPLLDATHPEAQDGIGVWGDSTDPGKVPEPTRRVLVAVGAPASRQLLERTGSIEKYNGTVTLKELPEYEPYEESRPLRSNGEPDSPDGPDGAGPEQAGLFDG